MERSFGLGFHLYQWLDVQDTLGDWLEAQVMKLDVVDGCVERIFVHYKGFQAKYDEWLHVASPRVAPLHTYSECPMANYEIHPQVGDRVDAQDTLGDWCVGVIRDSDPKHGLLFVHYVGWSSKYDEWINEGSYRLAPHSMFSSSSPQPPGRSVTTSSPDELETRPSTRINVARSNPSQQPNPSRELLVDEAAVKVDRSPDSSKEKSFRQRLQAVGLTIIEQSGDGNCLFRAISHQIYGVSEHHTVVRAKTVEYISLERSYFSGYIAGSFDDYIRRLSQDGVWGDHIELQAMAELYNRPIQIFAYSTEPFRTFQCGPRDAPPIRLSYHFRSHYNSITYLGHAQHFERSIPGIIEDDALQLRNARSPESVTSEAQISDLQAIDNAEMETALQQSRRQFSHESVETFDRTIQESLESLDVQYRDQLDSVLEESEQNQFFHEAALQSELWHQSSEDSMPQEPDHLAPPIRMCMNMGYPLEQCVRAYSVVESLQLDHQMAAAMMQEQLSDHIAQFQ